ncbi:MAG: SUMF1/EgtB/PvdO family nonheme iron enzyme, partial [Myxococcales bacterium]|nr:SUMF1/EgtB/PvdO family nonheme iron enzyme [Myxococcales bacterium]
EYIRGKSLHEFSLPLPWRRVLELAIGLARGLGAAHRQGVLHRDIKLANAILDEETGTVKLVDFGLAKLESSAPAPSADAASREPGPGDSGVLHISHPRGGARARPPDASPETGDELSSTAPHELLERLTDSQGRLRNVPSEVSKSDKFVGTPHYMAPELWRSEPATRETDVYALGVLMFILCTGRPPYPAFTPEELSERVQRDDPPQMHELAPAVDERLAAIIEKCMRRRASARYRSGDELREALEAVLVVEQQPQVAAGNPYRGLQAFQAKHRDLFFGRGAEIRAVVNRLRSDSFVLVAGDSGVGKSSLCRAGVAPLVVEGAFEAERRWSWGDMMPGRHPLQSLMSLLSELFGLDEERVLPLVTREPEKLGWLLHQQLGGHEGRLLFVDQLEELVTIADPAEAEIVGKILAQMAAGVPGVRVLASVRGDFLTRTAQVPYLGDELSRAIYLLRPLTDVGVREAIVGPAQARGVRYESEALIEDLVSAGKEGSLPILQFALAELWEVRAKGASVITAAELRRIGGVTGALARHADGLLASLNATQRLAARKLLMRLVTIDDTRASLGADDLEDIHEAAKSALEAMVHGRLLVAREAPAGVVYEIAHEALINGWGTLRHWLDEERELRELRHRLGQAAGEWKRLERPNTALWAEAQVDEADRLERASLRSIEREFLDASVRAVARTRRRRRAIVIAIPTLLALTYGGVRYQSYRDLQRRVDHHVGLAREHQGKAESAQARMQVKRDEAFASFDKAAIEEGEARWTKAIELGLESDAAFASAAREFESALTLDNDREDLRAHLGDALYKRALLAELMHDDRLQRELLERLKLYDRGGVRAAAWAAPATVSFSTSPPGAALTLERYDENGRRVLLLSDPKQLGAAPLNDLELAQGSYRLTASLEGHSPVLYPFVATRSASISISFTLPDASAVPDGFVYVPPGAALFGSADEVMRKTFLDALPQRTITTPAFLIARHETTFAQWIEFLETLPPSTIEEYSPRIDSQGLSQLLERLPDGAWRLTLGRDDRRYVADQGEAIVYPSRAEHKTQRWLEMPATGLTPAEINPFLVWLDRTGRLPGARLCTEVEWERAARGADARIFPHGFTLRPDEGNIDTTYNKDLHAVGADVVGSYPQTNSPFNIEDMVGNAFEWTTSNLTESGYVARGGGFFFNEITARATNRAVVPPNIRDSQLGIRLCAPFDAESSR